MPPWGGTGVSAQVVGRLYGVIRYREAVTLVQTLLVLLLTPAVIYGVVAALTLWPRLTKRVRYRTGDDWNFAPVYWVANPANLGFGAPATGTGATGTGANETGQDTRPGTTTGGARGNW